VRIIKAGLLLALAGLTGCSDEGDVTMAPPDDPAPAVSYAADVQPIWNSHCIGCHGAGGNAGLDLRASAGPAALVNVAATGYAGSRVVPGDPDASVLTRKLQGDPTTGDRMPLGGALSAGQIETIRSWIAAGALNN